MNKKNKLKILIAYHKPSFLLKSKIYIPIHVGRSIATQKSKDGMLTQKDYKWLMKNLVGDDTGENISHKNREWCELTAIYWAWKNYDKLGNPDYIGLMHYRRFFDFKNCKNNKDIENFVGNYDILIRIRTILNDYYVNNYIQYERSPHQHIEDLDKATDIVKRLYPEYTNAIEIYMKQDYAFFCNMFVMKKNIFFEYCKFIFSVLEQFEKEVDISGYNVQEKRVFGYLGERLTGIFYTHLLKQNHNIKTIEISQLPQNKIPNETFLEKVKRIYRKLKPMYS